MRRCCWTQIKWLRNKIDSHQHLKSKNREMRTTNRNKQRTCTRIPSHDIQGMNARSIYIALEGSEVIKFRIKRVLITFEISCICWIFIAAAFSFISVHFYSIRKTSQKTREWKKNSAQTICFDCTRARSSFEVHSTKG